MKLKTSNLKLKIFRSNSGNIVIPVLFVVIAFAILLTSGKMFNVSTTDPNEKFENPTTSNDPKKVNLQLKKLVFGKQADACNHDTGKKADPAVCSKCVSAFAYCVNGLCNDIDLTKTSMKGTKAQICSQVDQGNWCKPPNAKDGDGWYCIGKPVIYLYPQFPILVDVRVVTEGKVVVSDPQIEDGDTWSGVLAHPNGILFYNNSPYRELFYESETSTLSKPPTGFVFKSEDLEKELTAFIEKLGLTREDEKDEFLDWWLPRLEAYNSPYWFVSILEKEEKRRLDTVEISPKPDTFIEFIAYFKPLSEFEKVNELILPPSPARIGFTAVEWGGLVDY